MNPPAVVVQAEAKPLVSKADKWSALSKDLELLPKVCHALFLFGARADVGRPREADVRMALAQVEAEYLGYTVKWTAFSTSLEELEQAKKAEKEAAPEMAQVL